MRSAELRCKSNAEPPEWSKAATHRDLLRKSAGATPGPPSELPTKVSMGRDLPEPLRVTYMP
jgi:hypothetical protein